MTTDTPIVSSDAASTPTLCYEDVIAKVIEPLPSHLIEVRPGATTRDKKSAIALPYYDWRIMANRLNRLLGGRNWYANLQPWGDHKIICTLTILGVPKDSSGEGEADDENGGTSAEQQAKKRALAEHGLNYLYLLPVVWGDYDPEKKRFVNPVAEVEKMYRTARIEGLDLTPYISSARKPPVRTASSSAVASTATVASTASTPTEIVASTPPVNERTLQGIHAACEALKKPVPDPSTLTAESAKRLLQTLTNEYRAAQRLAAATK